MSENNQQNENNTVIDEQGVELKPKKINFFKKVWYSITKFEKYVEMSLEGTGRALKYLLQILSIYVLIIACIGIYNTNESLNSFVKNIEENAPEFKYTEGQMTLSENQENKVYVVDDLSLNFGKIIIDLNTEDESVVAQHEEQIINDSETGNMGFIVLKDKVIQIAKLIEGSEAETKVSMTYDEIMLNFFGQTDIEITKSSIIDLLNGSGRTSIFIVNFFANFIAYFIIYLSSGLIYTLILGFIGYISAKITKLNLKFSHIYAMSIYAFTLSNILNMLYFIANYFAGITIRYFDVAYIAIAYIYLVTVLFLIKTDFLRKQENEVKEKEKEKEEADGQEQI